MCVADHLSICMYRVILSTVVNWVVRGGVENIELVKHAIVFDKILILVIDGFTGNLILSFIVNVYNNIEPRTCRPTNGLFQEYSIVKHD